MWHRRGALEFRRFDEVRRDLGLELRRGDMLAAAAPRGEHVDDRVGCGDGEEETDRREQRRRDPGRARPDPFTWRRLGAHVKVQVLSSTGLICRQSGRHPRIPTWPGVPR